MPTYGYQCGACSHEFEIFQSMRDDALADCPACRKPRLKRKIGRGGGIIFKGKGFYETDYKRPAASANQESAKGETPAAPKADAATPAAPSAKPA